ncbi:MAG: PAS domain-containing sensor histidine kinase [Nitrospinota bacterium]|nr:PAS domain-containing sensor histidine kinase [Nitrospinota bacterium]
MREKFKAAAWEKLRNRAESILQSDPKAVTDLPPTDILRLIHELNVRQIELEMQNEELLRTQKELEDSKANYLDLFDFAPAGYLTMNGFGRIQEVNYTGASMLGVTRKSLMGKHLPLHGVEDGDTFHLHIQALKETGMSDECELRLRKADGSFFHAHMKSDPVKSGAGLPSKFRTTLLDITRRKTAEEENSLLIAAVESATDSVIITSPNGVIRYVNPAFIKNTGYSRDEAVGQNVSLLKSGEHDARFFKNIWQVIRAGQVWRGHMVNKRKNGSLYEDEIVITPVKDSKGNIACYVAVYHDVTAESNLRRAKEHFTMVTAHELRTPLTQLGLIKSFMDAFNYSKDNQEKVDKIKDIFHKSFNDMERIVTRAILLTELSAEGKEKIFADVYIHMLVKCCFENVQHDVLQSRPQLKMLINIESLPDDTVVSANQDMLVVAIDELLSNAVKYTDDGNTVLVRGHIDGELAVVSVLDEGVGIDNSATTAVLEPYHSLEETSHHSTGRHNYLGGGMGLGLTLAHLIAKYHNGRLDIHSNMDSRGTVATLFIPLARRAQ